MKNYDPDDYEYRVLLSEHRHAKKSNKYYAQNDPEAPEPDDEDDEDGLIYLTADTINGVMFSEKLDNDYDVLGDMDFYDALPSVEDGEVIYGAVSPDVYKRVEQEYGVRGTNHD